MWIRVRVTIHIFVCRSNRSNNLKNTVTHTLTHNFNFASFCIIFNFILAFFGFEILGILSSQHVILGYPAVWFPDSCGQRVWERDEVR